MVILWTIFPLCAIILAKKEKNVCLSFNDYKSRNINSNPNCFYHEDATLRSPEIIAKYAPQVFETHEIISEDGYILTLFRIAKKKEPKGIILLHHSIATDSRLFLWNGNESFAFNLWRNGYDVWLANHRGSHFSNKHRNMTNSQFEYWNFSFHEMAKFDVPAEVDYIRLITGENSKIIFVGHSLGSTIGAIYSTLFPEQTRKFFKGFILIAAPCFFKNSIFGLEFLLPIYRVLQSFLENTALVGDAVSFLPLLEKYGKILLRNVPEIISAVVEVVLLICGETRQQVNPVFFNFDALINLNDFSFKILFHYAQWLPSAANFTMYSYGSKKNFEIYGSKQAPNYQLENINVPVMLISGLNDALITVNNTDMLFSRLKASNVSNAINIILDGYNHLDFLTGKSTDSFIEAFYSLLENLK